MLYDPSTYKGIKGGTQFDETEFFEAIANKAPKSKSIQSNIRAQNQPKILYKNQKQSTLSAEKKHTSGKIQSPLKLFAQKQSGSSCSLNSDEYILKIKQWNQNMMNKIARTQQYSPPKKGILDQCIDSYMKKQKCKQIISSI
ncbi:unnamed protein product (macronuclear) [Paramecium tetraurelia]|uniref:Uncharacterized protein n=1 Tax=Paramecium tetraurelia TaxID=5888 RepID=A0DZ76_PARTE|nr:uncharacterized protein GSPATT00003312001 [Paramecium tetraurelia]CAK88343.1 unnamed protein product [Paramecium tetraurelia]|eukprot:XP_001455740.1 hypothetical protein (macronuclear) [Paramecium tetraurelia strain d4-2]